MVLKTLRVTFAARVTVACGDERVFVSLTRTTRRMAEGVAVPDRWCFQVTFVAGILLVAADALLPIEVGHRAMPGFDEFGRVGLGSGILVTSRAVVVLVAVAQTT